MKIYPNIVFVGDGAELHKETISNIALDNLIHAKNVGILAYNKYINGKIESADSILPLYLRKSQAERMKPSNEWCFNSKNAVGGFR